MKHYVDKSFFRKQRRKWEDNIKMVLKICLYCVDWINMTLYKYNL